MAGAPAAGVGRGGARLAPALLVAVSLVSVLVSVAATFDWSMRRSGDTPAAHEQRLSRLSAVEQEPPAPGR
jgi:hypothetical protein